MALLVPSVDFSAVSGGRVAFLAQSISTCLWKVRIPAVWRKSIRGGVKARVSSRIMHLEVLHGEFSATAKPSTAELPPKQGKEEEEKQNYYVNKGHAIRTLREEFPDLFYRELSFDLYRDDIVFKDPVNTFTGIESYKSIFWALRFQGRLFFRALWLDIVSMWQPSEDIIMVRWTVHGIPRVLWERRGRFDGTSEYKLDKHGKIYEHRVHNIALNSPPKFGVLSMDELIRSVGCPSTPKPTCFEFFPSWVKEFVHLFAKSIGVRVFLPWVSFSSPRPAGESTRKA